MWVTAAFAGSLVLNPGFEGAEDDASAWTLGDAVAYEAKLTTEAHSGEHAVRIRPTGAASEWTSYTETIDATSLRGKVVRLRGWVRVEGDARSAATLMLRVDRPSGLGFFDNMRDRPITDRAWRAFDITGNVAADATDIVIGALVFGSATTWLDDVSLEVVDDISLAKLQPSKQASAYLDEAIDVVRKYAWRSNQVDWDVAIPAARVGILGARTPADTYPAIRRLLLALGDQHSRFLPPSGTVAMAEAGADARPADVHLDGERLGYVGLYGYDGTAAGAIQRFAARTQAAIGELPNRCGWIVDLSDNPGGNMWPMLAGIGPLVGDGEPGAFAASTVTVPWRYSAGTASSGDYVQAKVDPPVTVRQAPVAVILSPTTASSGEAMALAFRGRPDTRSFGVATAGLSTGNALMSLSDGATIVLTTSVMVDRLGHGDGGPIVPDEPTKDREEALAAARDWLLAQPACR